VNRCREIPARRNKGKNSSEIPFYAFFDKTVEKYFQVKVLGKWPFFMFTECLWTDILEESHLLLSKLHRLEN
jgi:hypothetical protein